MKPRRVLVQAFACCPPGAAGFEGGEDLLGWMLIRQLAASHELWVLTHPRRRPGIESAGTALPEGTVHFHYIALWSWLERWLLVQGLHQCYYYLWQIAAWWRARRLHREVGFELFHHLTYANDWMGNVIGAFLPVPYLRGPGGGAQRVPRVLLKEFTWRDRFWQEIRSIGQWLFRHDPLFLISQHRARAILVCSQEAMEALPPRWRSKAQLFPVNGISQEDLQLLERSDTRRPDRFLVLSVGKLLRLKGFPLALRAFKLLVERYPNAELEIIGEGPDRLILERLVRTLGLERQVHLSPWMVRPQVLEAVKHCDVFLFPSLRDGGGAVVVEAMAAGKPVICLDLGGPGFHVQEHTGIKVVCTDRDGVVRDLAAALVRLYEDQPLRLAMGRKARERAVMSYHWERLGERMTALYGRVLDGKPLQQRSVPLSEEYASRLAF